MTDLIILIILFLIILFYCPKKKGSNRIYNNNNLIMTTQIDVVDINTHDNIEKNDTTLSEEVKQEEATPKSKNKSKIKGESKSAC